MRKASPLQSLFLLLLSLLLILLFFLFMRFLVRAGWQTLRPETAPVSPSPLAITDSPTHGEGEVAWQTSLVPEVGVRLEHPTLLTLSPEPGTEEVRLYFKATPLNEDDLAEEKISLVFRKAAVTTPKEQAEEFRKDPLYNNVSNLEERRYGDRNFWLATAESWGPIVFYITALNEGEVVVIEDRSAVTDALDASRHEEILSRILSSIEAQ